MARQITDKDIVAALRGPGPDSERSSNRDIVEALSGRRPAAERNLDTSIVEALNGNSYARTVTEGEVPLQRRGDDLEAVAIWAATEGASSATSNLAHALMRADASKGIYAAESEARAVAAEAYAEAAKTMVYEDHRQQHVKNFVTKMADITTRKPQPLATRTAAEASRTSDTMSTPKGPQRRETRSLATGATIIHYI